MKHFYAYPRIEYSENLATNIMMRGKVRDAVLQNTALYYKYTIDDMMKPETLSHKYYGSSNYVWAIFYANNILHPVHDWPMTQREFDKYIIQKYGSLKKANGKYNADGSLNHDSIHHYVLNQTHIIDRTTFTNLNQIFSGFKSFNLAYDELMKGNKTELTIGKFVIDKETFFALGTLNPESVSAVTYYEHEERENEKKRDVVIIDKTYLYQILSEFETLFD